MAKTQKQYGNPANYNATPPTLSDGDPSALSVDINQNLNNRESYAPAYEDNTVHVAKVEGRFPYTSITTQTTTVVVSGPGLLHTIIIPTPVALATVKVYDNTAASGSVVLDTVTFPTTLVSDGPITLTFDAPFSTGLTVITAGATMAVDVYARGATM